MLLLLLVITLLKIICQGNGNTITKTFTLSNSRIIGGNPTYIQQFPFAAAVDIQSDSMKWFCGGSLHGNQWIITAGQCVDQATLFLIRLGTATLDEASGDHVTVSSSTYFLHPEYNLLTLENDIGLIKLRMPVTFTDHIKPFNFLATEEIWANTRVAAIGWGQTSDEEGILSNSLQSVYVTTLTNDECKITYGSQIQDSMVCVNGNYNEGACHGDTGSPLVLMHPRMINELVGISSFVSSNGCESLEPSGYTRIFSYKDWIDSVTIENE